MTEHYSYRSRGFRLLPPIEIMRDSDLHEEFESLPKPEVKIMKIARSSASGKFISPDQAKENPNTTTVEQIKTMMRVTRYLKDGSIEISQQKVGTPIDLEGDELKIEVD